MREGGERGVVTKGWCGDNREGCYDSRMYLNDVHPAPEDLDVFHKLLGGVLGIQHGQLGEYAGVGIVQTQSLYINRRGG